MTVRIVCSVAAVSFLVGLGDAQAGQTGRYPSTYNLIDPDPSCRYPIPDDVCCLSVRNAQCPGVYSGAGDVDVMAIHPNIQERTDYTMRNMARLFPSYFVGSEWGWSNGVYKDDCDQPATTPTKPFYFMSEAVQAGRWNSFSGATEFSGCTRGDCGDDCIDAQTSHYTCDDGTDASYCDVNTYGQCGYKYRSKGMVQLLFSSNSWNDVGSEGIWGGTSALQTSASHCGMVFNAGYHHQGIGYYPSGATTMVGIYDTEDWEDHVFPHGTHFGWDRSQYTFLTQFFGGKQTDPVSVGGENVFLLYKGEMIAMDEIVSNDAATGTSAFYRSDQPLSAECEPYAFVAMDSTGTLWRLPENERYYFATVDHPDSLIDGSATCAENHYYDADGSGSWVANGGEGLTNAKSGSGCEGCSKIAALEAAFDAGDISYSTPPPTIATPEPTTPSPTTPAPTVRVTRAPTVPTVPTTAAPTTPFVDCGDYQCITIDGLDDFDGDWAASGDCFSDKSVYTQSGRDDDVKLCLSGSTWTFTDTVCETDDSRAAYCNKVRADIGYCSGTSAWTVRGDDGSFTADATMTLSKTYEQCAGVTPSPNADTPSPTVAGDVGFMVGSQAVSGYNAQAYCEGYGATLASVHSEAERDEVLSYCETQSSSCWIGLTLSTDKTTWTWSDGTAIDYGFNADGSPTVGAGPWYSGEPNDWKGSEDCTMISNRHNDWNDAYCWSSAVPICFGLLSGMAFEGIDEEGAGGLSDVDDLAIVLVVALIVAVVGVVALLWCRRKRAKGAATFEAGDQEMGGVAQTAMVGDTVDVGTDEE